MKEELLKIIEEYLKTLEEEVPVYYENGGFDHYKIVKLIPTFTGFIEFLSHNQIK